MSDARVSMLSAAEALEVAARAKVPAQLADLSIFRVLLRRERLAKASADLLLSLLFGGVLDPRLRELIIMRIGWATGSVYEWTQHWPIALDAGLTEPEVLGVRAWREYDGYGDSEQAVLEATDQALGRGAVDADGLARLRHHLGEDAALEVVAVIAIWSMVSQILRSLDIPLEEGVVPWPPDGQVPEAEADANLRHRP